MFDPGHFLSFPISHLTLFAFFPVTPEVLFLDQALYYKSTSLSNSEILLTIPLRLRKELEFSFLANWQFLSPMRTSHPHF